MTTHRAPCPACMKGEVVFESATQKDADDREWTSISSIDHPEDCTACAWSWDREKDVIGVETYRTG